MAVILAHGSVSLAPPLERGPRHPELSSSSGYGQPIVEKQQGVEFLGALRWRAEWAGISSEESSTGTALSKTTSSSLVYDGLYRIPRYRVDRSDYADGSKSFSQKKADGNGGFIGR